MSHAQDDSLCAARCVPRVLARAPARKVTLMSEGNLTLLFGAGLAGAILLKYGLADVSSAFAGSSTPASAGGSATTGVQTGSGSNSTPVASHGFPASVNPLPGAQGGRLDQGIDGTGSKFLTPWTGTVVYSNAHDSGWAGGGYVAVQSADDPSLVWYIAEGIAPLVKQGQHVVAGQNIATPIASPYNGIVGNFEGGLANPNNPRQPLAQVTQDASAMVNRMYQWLQSLGGPTASSTAHAGLA